MGLSGDLGQDAYGVVGTDDSVFVPREIPEHDRHVCGGLPNRHVLRSIHFDEHPVGPLEDLESLLRPPQRP